MLKLLKYYPLVKIDEKTHTVTGMATAEEVDLDREIAVYADTKPQYIQWSSDAAASTKAAGQDVSLGNIRVQHTSEMGGKVTAVHYDDAKRQIFVETQPKDDAMWEQLKGGFYRGFSHAGSYLYRKCAQCDSEMDRGHYCLKCKKEVDVKYAPVLAEISYVDSPCLKSATFTAVKSDGSTEIRKFAEEKKPVSKTLEILHEDALVIVRKHPDNRITVIRKEEKKTKRVDGEDLASSAFLIVGDKADTATWKLPVKFSTEEKTKSHVRNALARFGQLKDVSEEDKAHAWRKLKSLAEEHGIDVDEDAKEKSLIVGGLYKGMYQISALADVLSTIRWLQQMCMDEGVWEEDPRDAAIADDIREWLVAGVEILKDIVEEETDELTATAAKGAGMANTATKARKSSLAAHFDKTKTHHEKMAAHHMDMHKAHLAKAEHHEKAMGKAEDGTDHKEHAAFHKAMGGYHEKCAKSHEAQADHCGSMADKHEEETEKAAKGVTVPAPAAPASPAQPAASDPAAPATKADAADPNDPNVVMKTMIQTTMAEMLKSSLEDFKNGPEARKMMAETIAQSMRATLDTTIVPDGARVAAQPGITLVPRPGEVNKAAPANNDSFAIGA